MKKRTTFILLLLCALALASCEDVFNDNSYEDDIVYYGGAFPTELATDSLFIHVHSIQYYSNWDNIKWDSKDVSAFYRNEPTAFSSLDDVQFEYQVCYNEVENRIFYFNAPTMEYEQYREVFQTGWKWGRETFEEIADAMQKYNKYGETQYYLYAGVNGHVRIYADKELFGIPAGGDLNEFFAVKPLKDSRFIVTYPDFHIVGNSFEEKRLWSVDECFAEGTAVNINGQALLLKEAPSETYGEITFTLEIPMLGDCLHTAIWGDDYPEDFYAKGYVRRSEPRVLHGSVTVKFE